MKCYKKSATSHDTNVSWSRLRYGITAVDVAPKSMRIRVLDEDGVLIDEITLQRP